MKKPKSMRTISASVFIGLFILLVILGSSPLLLNPSKNNNSPILNTTDGSEDLDSQELTNQPIAQTDNQDLIGADSLIARYTFDNPADMGHDDSGNGNNGNAAGNAEVVSDPERGNVLHLPGNTTDYIRFPTEFINANNLNQITFSFWLKIEQVPEYAAYKYYGYVFRSDINSEGFRIFYAYDSEAHPNAEIYGYAGYYGSSSAYDPLGRNALDRWKMVTIVYDANQAKMTFYIDGRLNYVRTLTGSPTITLGQATLGRYDQNYYPCNASFDDFRIYSKALSADEIFEIYKGDEPAPWYDGGDGSKEWQFRTNVEFLPTVDTTDYLIDQEINFTQLLHDIRLNGTIDYNSITLVEWNQTDLTNDERTLTKAQASGFDSASNAVVNLQWTVNGSTDRWNNRERPTQWRNAWSVGGGEYAYGEFLNTWSLLGTWDKTDPEYQALPTSGVYYSPGQLYDQHVWFEDIDDYFVYLGGIFDGTEYNKGKWAQSYFYIPNDISDMYITVYEYDEQVWVYLDGTAVISDETSSDSQSSPLYQIVYSLGAVSKGWHSVLVRSDNNNDNDQAIAVGFSNGTPSSTSYIEGMVCSSSAFAKPRQYYLYFNITESTPTPYYDNNEFGSNTNGTISPQIKIKSTTYNGYSQRLLTVLNADWWDYEWDYRVLVNVTAPDDTMYSNYLITLDMDFTSLLAELGNTHTFDENSIRVIEYDEYFGTLREIPSQFDKDRTFVAETNAIGQLSWVVDGKTVPTRTRFYFIYFDTTEYGLKDVKDYSSVSSLSIEDNGGGTDFTIQNDKIRISLGLGDVGAGSSQDHIYDVYDKRVGIQLCGPEQHGWALLRWNYGNLDSGTGYFTELNNIEVVSSGPIRTVVKMSYENDYFIYSRYYTMNYLDDTIKITHEIYAKQAITYGSWEFANDWDNGITTNYGLGVGGLDFLSDADTSIDNSGYFTLDDNVVINTPDTIYPNVFLEPAWYAVWDETNKVGVGTIWDSYPTTQYGGTLRTTETHLSNIEFGTGGRNNILDVQPQSLDLDESFTFTMWGQVFNAENALITKERAPGLQTEISTSMGSAEESQNAKITLHCVDIDNAPIENAAVLFINSTDPTINFTKYTNEVGNVTFKGLDDRLWDIKVLYAVNDVKNYTIATENYTIDTQLGTVLKFYQTINCNLTTLDITVIDSAVSDPNNWALNNANVTLMNATANENITSFYSDPEGKITIKLPATTWNFSVEFQGKPKTFGFDNELEANFNYTNTLTVSAAKSILFNVSTNLYKTKLSVAEYRWDSWQSSNTSKSVDVYYRDNLTIALYYEAISGGTTIIGPIDAANTNTTWILTDSNDNQINGSITGTDFVGSSGYFNITLQTTDYMAGTYELSFNFVESSGDYQNATLVLTLNILNASTSLELISPDDNLKVKWSEEMSLQFHYYENYPVEGNNITNGQFWFVIEGKTSPAQLTYWNEAPYQSWGIYNLSWIATLSPGIYTLTVYGNETNFAYATYSVGIQILPQDTNFSISISEDYKYTNTYVKVAEEEIATFNVSYTNTLGGYLGTDARVTAIMQGVDNNTLLSLTDLGTGVYLVQVNASLYNPGSYTIKIHAELDNYTSYTQYLDIDILDYWDTSLNIIEPPVYYPWGNNATFIIKYTCAESPRTNLALTNATITQLNITYKVDTVEYTQILLTQEDMASQKWGWTELVNDPLYQEGGYYLVWFNTSVVNVTQKWSFYAIPSIHVGVYREATVRPYVWIAPVGTSVTPKLSTETKPLESIELKLDQSASVIAHVNITEEDSSLLGMNVANAAVSYRIVDSNTNDLLEQGTLTSEGNGDYSFTLNAYELGNYTVSITAVLENYSTAVASFTYIVSKKPVTLQYQSGISGGIISTPLNQETEFTIEAIDTVHNEPLTGATIKLVKSDGTVWKTYDPSITDPDNDGVYVIHLSLDDLESLDAKTQFTVIFEKENYTMADTFIITISVELPVDPYFGIPYVYWELIGVTAAVMIGAMIANRIIKNARIPLFIKQIQKMKADISKNRVLGDKKVTKTVDEEIVEQVGDRWAFIGLDLGTILGLQNSQGNMTPGDNVRREGM